MMSMLETQFHGDSVFEHCKLPDLTYVHSWVTATCKSKVQEIRLCAISEPDTPLPRLPLQESMCKECLDYKRRCLALGLSGMCYDQPDFRSYKGIESRGIIKKKKGIIRGTRSSEEF